MAKTRSKGFVSRVALSVLTGLFLILTIVTIVASYIANVYEATLNAYFNTRSYEMVDIESDEYVDTEYYKSSFVTARGGYDDEALWDYDLRVAQQVVNEGCVLLWNNDSALPLNKGSAVSLFGNTSVNFVYTGSGSGSINISGAINMKDGMEQYDFSVNPVLWNLYDTGAGSKGKGYGITQAGGGDMSGYIMYVKEAPWSVVSSDSRVVSSFSEYGDAAIFVLGRSGGEGKDILATGNPDTLDGNYLEFSPEEMDVLDHLVELKGQGVFDKIVLLINSGNAVQFKRISTYMDDIDACMWVGEPGAGGMPGIAKLLCGDANPSGHLPDTYCYDNLSSPAMVNFYSKQWLNAGSYSLGGTQQYNLTYQEGIYVGYKYYETRYEDVVLETNGVGDYDYESTVIYPFGYGMSYSTFAFSDYKVTPKEDGDYEVSVTVTNTGDVAGRQVAQIYLQKPYTDYDVQNGIEKAAVELVGYAKTGILEPKASQTLTITVDDQDFKSYDSNGYKTYIREAGKYYLAVGENAHDALNNILIYKSEEDNVHINAEKMVGTGDKKLVGKITFADTDTTTYAVSQWTGMEITNQFDFVDVNRNPDVGDQSITYLSRNNWEGTYPREFFRLNLTPAMVEHLAYKRNLPEAKADADEYYETHDAIVYDQPNGLSLIQMLELDYDAEEWDLLMDQMSWADQALVAARAYHATSEATSINMPGTIIENGPLGVSVTFSTMNARRAMGWPCEPTRAATFNTPLNELMGKMFGEDLLHADVNGCLGYGLNMHRTPYGARNFEYYSEDSFLSGEACKYETLGAQSKGAIIQIKHFVANDFDTVRNGTSTFMNEQAMREIYLSCYETAFCEGKAWSTMVSTARIGNEWAGGSYALCTTVLRGEWGFQGYTSSDYTAYSRLDNNAYIGIQAGCDTYDAPEFSAATYDDVKNDPTFQFCIRRAAKRVAYTVLHSSAMNGIRSTTKIVHVNTWWQNALIGLQVGLAVITVVFGGLLAWNIVKLFKSKKNQKEGEANA